MSAKMMTSSILLFTAAMVYGVRALPEVNHLVQTDSEGMVVHMDIIHDADERTVLAIIGDVSMYENGEQTVNFHDYNTGFGALKNINEMTCILTHTLVPMRPEAYKMGVTNEVHEHYLNIMHEELSHQAVTDIGGTKVAEFCKDYSTFYADAVPIEQAEREGLMHREVRALSDGEESRSTVWCIFSKCKTTQKVKEQ